MVSEFHPPLAIRPGKLELAGVLRNTSRNFPEGDHWHE